MDDSAAFRTELGNCLGGLRRALRSDEPLSAEDRDGISGYLGCVEHLVVGVFHQCLDLSPSDQSEYAQNRRAFVAHWNVMTPEEIRAESLAICQDLGGIRRLLLDLEDDLDADLRSSLAAYLEIFEGVLISLAEDGG